MSFNPVPGEGLETPPPSGFRVLPGQVRSPDQNRSRDLTPEILESCHSYNVILMSGCYKTNMYNLKHACHSIPVSVNCGQ